MYHDIVNIDRTIARIAHQDDDRGPLPDRDPSVLPARLHEIATWLAEQGHPRRAHDLLLAAKDIARHNRRPIPDDSDTMTLHNPLGHWYVYVAVGPRDTIIYVGMTGILFDRLGAHQSAAVDNDPRRNWMKYATRIDLHECSTKAEASAIERSLIRRHRPPYNTAGVNR